MRTFNESEIELATRDWFAELSYATVEGHSREELDGVIKQLVSDDVINIFDAAGLRTPDVSILSDHTRRMTLSRLHPFPKPVIPNGFTNHAAKHTQ